ncbi:hypothetical protein [Fontibacillus phaseoli]|uniref:hypothetical protein n=1 Tax=Fontibacillus phaseoli TaxID=1416533 RepID=UPI0011C04CF7|nr:hypothetical protein [Fontibacillus phaseoli]
MLFSSLGVATASDVSNVGIDAARVETVSVRDIVPEEYFASVAGKYQSKEEVQEATGFENVKSEKISKMQFENGAIIVKSFDEYAALLQYYSDFEKQQANDNQRSFSPTAIVNDYTEKTIWGDGLAGGGAKPFLDYRHCAI